MKNSAKLLFISMWLLASAAEAAVCTSIFSGNWNAPGTWSCTAGTTPAAGDTVILASPYAVSLNNTDRTAASLTIEAGATLNDDGQRLTVTGNVVNNGIFGTNGGSLRMTGTNATLSGLGTFDNTDVEIDAVGISLVAGSIMEFANQAQLRIGNNNAASFMLNGAITGNGLAAGDRIVRVYQNSSMTVNGSITAPNAYIRVEQNASVTNNGVVSVQYLDSDGNNVTSVWTQGVNSSLTLAQTPANRWRGSLNASATGNTVTFDGAATPFNPETYYNIAGTGVTCPLAAGITVLGASACAPGAPAVITNAASGLSVTGATLNGTVRSNGAITTASFEYGLTNTYGSTVAATPSPLAANAANTAVSAALTGLTCGTTYHFRAKGASTLGTTNGGDLTFTTSACIVCNPPSNIPVGVTVTCQCDNFARVNLNPSTIFTNGNWVATTSDATGIVPRIVNSGYMRLTENTANNAKAATVPGIFPAAGNYISVEFKHYAYNGSNPGADGIAVTLSDYAVTAQPGAFGGSLGYAQRTGVPGFAAGWIGVALDEYGNYQNATEGRVGGPGFIVQSVGVRGSGSGMTGYPWLRGTANLTTVAPNIGIDNRASATPSLGDYYQVIVDSRANNGASGPALVSVNRDTTGVGNTYSSLIPPFDAFAAATAVGHTQAPVPVNWQVSFTGSTGGSNNIHEIGALRICAQSMVPSSGGTPSGFNAIDEANARSDVNAISGHLYTKLAGTPFTVKVAALNTTGTGILTTYAFAGNKTVTVNLIDDSAGTSCNASAAACSACTKPVVATQSMTFASTNTGFKQSANFTVPAYSNLLVQMSDGTTTGCSTDTFAVRPPGISSVTSTNATGASLFKAGNSNFALTATTTAITGTSGYAGGVPSINAASVQALAPVPWVGTNGVLSGNFSPAASGTSSATATGSTFTYDEVGSFYIQGPGFALVPPRIPGVYDDAWAAVDSGAKGDCIAGTTAEAYSNTKDANGKFGCNFGITADTGFFGRFVPDHFDTAVELTSGLPMLCPVGGLGGLACPALYPGFVYSGQLFTANIYARNFAGGLTRNYDNNLSFAKQVTLSVMDMLGGTTAVTNGSLDNTTVPASAFKDGSTVLGTPVSRSYTFNATATAPTNIYIRADDTDGVTSLRGVSIEGGVQVVSGRVKVNNVYGSELLPLTLAATAQYYTASGWLNSTADNVTKLASIAASYSVGTGSSAVTVTPATKVLSGGKLSIKLAAPNTVGSVTITPTIDAASPGNPPFTLGTGTIIPGTATFGIYKSNNNFIYRRESY